jgi:hypothetical protein
VYVAFKFIKLLCNEANDPSIYIYIYILWLELETSVAEGGYNKVLKYLERFNEPS